MRTREFGNVHQILADVDNTKTLSIVVAKGAEDFIPAGTPVKGDVFTDEQAAATVSNDTDAIGVLLHDVKFDEGKTKANGTLLYFGTVNENRLADTLTITPEAKTALAGKVTFIKRNK